MLAYAFLAAYGAKDGEGDEQLASCRVEQLAYWLSDELWLVELGGAITEGRHRINAERARRVERVEAWSAAILDEFASSCIGHARDVVADAVAAAGFSEEANTLRGSPLDALGVYAWELGALPARGLGGATGLLGEAADDASGDPVLAAYECALAVGVAQAGGLDHDAEMFTAGLGAERAWQSAWLDRRLRLRTALATRGVSSPEPGTS